MLPDTLHCIMVDGVPPPPAPEGPSHACQRCRSPMSLLAVLPRTGELPLYRIFGCTACTFIEWIAEHISEM